MAILIHIKNFLIGKQREKIKERPGVIGHYDSKPFHNFRYALIYAGDTNIYDTNDKSDVELFVRVYRGVTFVNILVNNDVDINPSDYEYDKIKPILIEKGIIATDKSISVMCFQHYTQKAVDAALNYHNSDKNHFYQALVFNAQLVQMDFYRPVPKYYNKMYDLLCEDLYFDFGFVDLDKD